tara:strand:+ start:480 stop:1238 length:759 start_codon:yes stop_codon:yes gene_type:complete
MKNKYTNKNILIVGSSTGLGFAIGKKYLELNANVIFTGYKNLNFLKKLKTKYPKKMDFFIGDLALEPEIINLCNHVKKRFKKIDIIVHTLGGGFGLTSDLISYNDLLYLYKVNLAAGVEINRILFKNLNKKYSYIVHVGSTASVQAIGSVGYNTVKTALRAYVKSFASRVVKKGVIVSSIMPGAFIAPNNHFEKMKKNNIKYFNDFQDNKIKIPKISSYKDIIPLVILLTNDDGKMLAGSNVLIDACETNAY